MILNIIKLKYLPEAEIVADYIQNNRVSNKKKSCKFRTVKYDFHDILINLRNTTEELQLYTSKSRIRKKNLIQELIFSMDL